jgi:hypothetical protein
MVVAQEEMVLALDLDLTAVIVLAEGGQENDDTDDRACDEQDYMVAGDTLENKDADNAVQRTCSAGGKDKAHANTLPVIGEVVEVEVDRHEEANAHKHELGATRAHMQLVVNEHVPVVVLQAQAWWE